jgi:hypothetical protein
MQFGLIHSKSDLILSLVNTFPDRQDCIEWTVEIWLLANVYFVVIMQMPSLNLEFLGNFLAELTLMEYRFLPYLPSLVAASAVFMAKLTLDSSTHPWVCISPSCMPTSFDSR